MTTEMNTVTLETLYAELLEIKTMLRSAPPALAAAAAKKVGKAGKKLKAASDAASDGSAPAEPKEKVPSTNPWILFSARVEKLVREVEEASGVPKENKMKTVVVKQFASALKTKKAYAEWADDEIKEELSTFTPPEVSKQAAEGKSKKQKKEAASAAGSVDGSDGEEEAPAAEEAKKERKPRRKLTEEEKAARKAKMAAKKAAAAGGGAEEDGSDEEEAEAPALAGGAAAAAGPAKAGAAEPKPAAKPLAIKPKPKKVDLSFFGWSHEGSDYYTNDRGDVITTDMVWVGRYDGKKIVECEEPEDLADATMREE